MSYHSRRRRGMGDATLVCPPGQSAFTIPGVFGQPDSQGCAASSSPTTPAPASSGNGVLDVLSTIFGGPRAVAPVYAQPTGPSTTTVLLIGAVGLAGLYFVLKS